MVVPNFELAALGGLVLVVELLSFVRRVPDFVPPFTGVNIRAPLHFVVDGLTAEAQLPGDLGNGYFCF